MAQALQAASGTVDDGFVPTRCGPTSSVGAITTEPVRYEVDRLRNGRSFCTRRVVARQAIGAILNLEASFQVPEEGADVETVLFPPDLPDPDGLPDTRGPR